MAKIWNIIFLLIVFAVLPNIASAATLSISPTSGTFELGDRVTVRIVVSSATAINAVSGTVFFPTSLFSIESVSKSGSLLNFWVSEPNFSKGTGLLHFEGVALGGFNGGSGTVVTAILRADKVGSGSVSFNSVQVLANDGQGTDVTDGTSGATYSIVPAKAKSPRTIERELQVEKAQPAPSLVSPEIMLTSKFGEQAIAGQSNYPNAQVLLTFVSEDGVKIFITDKTDNVGGFTLLVPKTLKNGVYRVHAVVVQHDLVNSYTSNEITITIGNIFSDIGWTVRWVMFMLLIVLIYLAVHSYYLFKRERNIKTFVKKEAHEAEAMVHKSFDLMREDMSDTREMKKDLQEAESLISKEIKDIAKL
jgi:hypothetical protein